MDSTMERVSPNSSDTTSLYGRSLILFFGSGAITFSIFSIYSCQFFSYRALDGEPWEDLSHPFDELAEASVGLFRFSEHEASSGFSLFGDYCREYDDWADVGQTTYFYVAQWTSMAAPGAAFLALAQILFEFCCCRLKGSYMMIRFFFFSACILQACTFMMFMDKQYCLDAASQNSCQVEWGGWYSIGSMVVYLVLAIFATSMAPYKDKVSGRCCIWTRVRSPPQSVTPVEEAIDEEKKPESDTDKDDDEGYQDIPDEESDDDNYDKDLEGQDFDQKSTAEWDEENNELVITANSTGLISDVGLNENEEDPEIPKETAKTAEAYEATSYAERKSQRSTRTTLPVASASVTVETEHSRHPDFLDMCCGDPLELEHYMTGKEKETKRRRSRSRRSSSRRMAHSSVGPQPPESDQVEKPDPKLGTVL